MNTPTKIAKEAGITLFGESYGGFARFLFIGLLSRWVGPELIGLYAMANAVTRITAVVATFGMDRGVLRFVSYYRSLKDESRALQSIATAVKVGFLAAVLLMLVQILLSGYLTERIFHENHFLAILIIFFAFGIPTGVLTNIMGFATQGYKLLKYKVAVMQIIQPTMLLIGFTLSYLVFSEREALILPILLAEAVGFTAIWWFTQKLTGIRLKDIRRLPLDREMLTFSSPLMLMTIVSTLMHWIDIIMLGIFLDSAHVGLYQPAVRTMGIIRMFMLAFNGIFSPMISELYAQKKTSQMAHLFQLVFRWIFTLSVPFVIVLMLYPGKIMLLFGADFIGGKGVVQILALGILIQSVTGIGGSLLVMIGRTRLNLMNILIAAAVNVVLNLVLIPRMGIEGAAWGTVGAMLTLAGLRLVECRWIAKLSPFQWQLLKPILAGSITSAALFIMKPIVTPWHTVLTLITVTSLSGLLYIALIALLRLDADDREVLQAIRHLMQRKPK